MSWVKGRPVRRILASVAIMLVGSSFVFAAVALMNRGAPEQEETTLASVIDFTVNERPPVQQNRDQPQQRRTAAASDEPALAPLPDLGGGLSSIQVEMPNYDTISIGAATGSLLGNVDNVVMTDESVDERPEVISLQIPYPSRARQRQIEGRVVVSVLIGTDGKVQNARLIESQPPGVFDQSVIDAMPEWRFTPARYKNRDVPVWVTIPLDFSLQ